MCQICRKLNKGSITVDEAREELEEQAEFLTEEHIEEIEELLFEAEDTYDYINEHKAALLNESSDDGEDGVVGETDLPDYDEEYDLKEEDD